MAKLAGKIAVITGATAGMALATAKLFVAEGAYVFITGRNRDRLAAAVDAIGKDVTGVSGDASDLGDLDRLYATVAREKGRIDVLFASAGCGDDYAPLAEVTVEHVDRIMDLNVRGTLFTVQKALPLLSDGASVILNGSMASVKGFAGSGVYSASKAAVRSFARTWTVDLKARKIRVNTLSPGTVNTAASASLPAASLDRLVARIPRGTIGQPDEIATAALFLACSDSSFVSGVELFVDGGMAQI